MLEDQFKTGYKTTEFWVGLIGIVVPGIGTLLANFFGVEIDVEGIIALGTSAVTAAAYILSRSYLKGKRNEAVATISTAEVIVIPDEDMPDFAPPE